MQTKKLNYRLAGLFLLFVICFFGSFFLGRYPIDPVTLIRVLLSKLFPITSDWPSQAETIIFQIRLPRVVMGMLIGAGLTCAGASYQALFQNPLVSPDVLGVSAGAGFGAALGLFVGLSYRTVSFSSFAFGLLSIILVYLVSSQVKNNPSLGLVLAGMMIGSLFTSAVSFLKLVADPNNTLPVITYWLMGSLASIRLSDMAFAAPLILIGIVPVFLLRWQINVLTLGEEEARCIGINTRRIRCIIIVCATMITAASVSVSGLIGWVGLVIPHLTRILVGNDYRIMLPASLLLGGSFLLIVDNFARLLATSEIPIGILTAFIGAPFFLYLIIREGKKL